MKNILNKIYMHPLFIITFFIFMLIGRFRFMICYMILILVHELGHILVSLLFKWKIDKIIILPFGGLTKYNNFINTKINEEFLVAISGVILQMIFYILVNKYIDYKYFSYINYFIIIFNLIPIYPLDGSKILSCFFYKITTFKISILLTLITSYILLFFLSIILFDKNKIIFLLYIFLYKEVNILYSNKKLIFNKFLLERYLNNFNFKKEKIIKSVDKMKKDYKHLFYFENKYMTESTFLKKMFDINKNL